jgi:hypothetical protein
VQQAVTSDDTQAGYHLTFVSNQNEQPLTNRKSNDTRSKYHTERLPALLVTTVCPIEKGEEFRKGKYEQYI